MRPDPTFFTSKSEGKKSSADGVTDSAYKRLSSIIFPVYFPLFSRACQSVGRTSTSLAIQSLTPARQIGARLNYICAGKEGRKERPAAVAQFEGNSEGRGLKRYIEYVDAGRRH